MESVIIALAGLFILEMYMAKDIYHSDATAIESMPKVESAIFALKDWIIHYRSHNDKIHPYYNYLDETSNEIIK